MSYNRKHLICFIIFMIVIVWSYYTIISKQSRWKMHIGYKIQKWSKMVDLKNPFFSSVFFKLFICFKHLPICFTMLIMSCLSYFKQFFLSEVWLLHCIRHNDSNSEASPYDSTESTQSLLYMLQLLHEPVLVVASIAVVCFLSSHRKTKKRLSNTSVKQNLDVRLE